MGVCEALRKAHVFADLDDDSLEALRAHTGVVDYDNLRAWLAERPQVGDALTRQAAGWLRVGAEVMSDLVLLDVPGRLAKALLQLSERFGTATADGGIYLTHDLTQDDLAQLVGASRETVNKALAEFVNRGWIQLRGRAVLILDVSRMRNRAAVQVARDPTDFEDLQTWPTEPRILIQ